MLFFKKKKSFDDFVRMGKEDANVLFIDCREHDEYHQGHVENSLNYPVSKIETLDVDFSTPLYVYCLSGARSRMACMILRKMGYLNVTNIGGISSSKMCYSF